MHLCTVYMHLTNVAFISSINYLATIFVLLSKLLEGYVKKIFYNIRQLFTMTKNMASSGLRESVILNEIILITDGTIGCVKGR